MLLVAKLFYECMYKWKNDSDVLSSMINIKKHGYFKRRPIEV